MKAFVASEYGSPDVLRLREVERPVPGEKEVLIAIRATTVTAGDWRARSLTIPRGFKLISRLFLGVRRPRQPILGSELAGEVVAVGEGVTRFAVGDHVFAYPNDLGCHAEYKAMPEEAALALKPSGLSFEEAAALSFGGMTALRFLRRGGIQSGDRVLVNGASGGVGTAAVQLAKHFGADVTGVCSTANLDLVRSLGADRVIDYTSEDVIGHGETYDIVVDAVGTLPFARSNHLLEEDGRLLAIVGTLPELLQIVWVSMTSSKKVLAGPTAGSAEDLRFLAGLAEAGAVKPFIDRRYPFEQMVEAHRYVDSGRKRGNVVITLT